VNATGFPSHTQHRRIVAEVHAQCRLKHADALDAAARRLGFTCHQHYKMARKARHAAMQASRPPLCAIIPARGRGVFFSVRIEGAVFSAIKTVRGPVITGHAGVTVPLRDCLVTEVDDIYAPGSRFCAISPAAGGEGIDIDELSECGRACLAELFGLTSASESTSMLEASRFDHSAAGRQYDAWTAAQMGLDDSSCRDEPLSSED